MAGKGTNFYELLEISPRARREVVDAAYKALAQVYHPDRTGDDRVSKNLGEAYATLKDEKARRKYDRDLGKGIGKVLGSYRIIDQIAEGGFGRTYRGEHTMLGTPVCIKHASHVSPQDEAILMEEAKAIWDLRHYAIPSVREILKLEDGSLALVMSFISGPTLEQIVDDKGPLDAETVCWITERVLNALRYLHFNGVVHGDVKPQNIIVQPDKHMVVLVDYGLSLIRPAADSSAKGYTPFYASPEQVSGLTLLPESDFYSLGMTMIASLGGDLGRKRVPEDLPDKVCDFIRRLVAHDILDRPRWDSEDLIESLRGVRIKSFGRSSSFGKKIAGLG
jgi:serine/threonine protein kinase